MPKKPKRSRLPEEGVDELFKAAIEGGITPAREEREPAQEEKVEKVESVEPAPQPKRAEALGSEGDVVERAVEVATSNPRISVYSPVATAVLLAVSAMEESTVSSIAREVLEEGLRERYPEVFRRVKALMKPKQRRRVPRSLLLK